VDLVALKEALAQREQPAFRLGQVWAWAARGAGGYAEMTDLPRALREELEHAVPFWRLEVERESRARDGTLKLLMRTADERPIEAVLMRFGDGRRSICLSSQSGCPLTCRFCATGSMRFGRNLSVSEMLEQALALRQRSGGGALSNAVFMGMGEPMLNLENVLEVCRRLPDLGITHRRIAVSTVGWIPGIEQLAQSDMPVRLALSLHAPDEALRTELMPVNERFPLADVLAACRDFYARRHRRVFVEYVMLAGVNDRYEQALQLARILDHEAFTVNLIPYNPTDGAFQGSSRGAIDAFRGALEAQGVRATVRLTRGREIDAACGQLAVSA
jgi:23S rRNA (adenine2503-C2)-methyltransferase